MVIKLMITITGKLPTPAKLTSSEKKVTSVGVFLQFKEEKPSVRHVSF